MEFKFLGHGHSYLAQKKTIIFISSKQNYYFPLAGQTMEYHVSIKWCRSIIYRHGRPFLTFFFSWSGKRNAWGMTFFLKEKYIYMEQSLEGSQQEFGVTCAFQFSYTAQLVVALSSLNQFTEISPQRMPFGFSTSAMKLGPMSLT